MSVLCLVSVKSNLWSNLREARPLLGGNNCVGTWAYNQVTNAVVRQVILDVRDNLIVVGHVHAPVSLSRIILDD